MTFISEKQIEELFFAWCWHKRSGRFHRRRQSCDFTGGSHNPGYPYEAFKNDAPWDGLTYKDWSAAALRMLQMHTFAVVGGVHIQQVVTQPKLTNLTCPTLPSGQVDVAQSKGGMVTCSATGTGLNLVSAASLVKGTSSVSGKVQPATDGNSASITFNPADLCDKQGAYSLTLTYKSDTQKNPTDLDSGESALLGKQPTISSIGFANDTLTLNGGCLGQLNSVALAPQVGNATVKGASPALDQNGKNTGATSQFAVQTVSGKTGLVPGAIYYLTYTSRIPPSQDIRKETLTITIAQLTPGISKRQNAEKAEPQSHKDKRA